MSMDDRNKRIETAARGLLARVRNADYQDEHIAACELALFEALLEPDPADRTAIDQAYANGRADALRDVREYQRVLREVLGARP